ncbi:hypothetical protein Hanom_Chr04g00334801 [Helianthus anomalus]
MKTFVLNHLLHCLEFHQPYPLLPRLARHCLHHLTQRDQHLGYWLQQQKILCLKTSWFLQNNKYRRACQYMSIYEQ